MSLKSISYTVSIAGIEPGTKQTCGVQGDHNIYRLEFNIDKDLWEKLEEQKNSNQGTLYYHFDLYNGEGDVTNTEPQALESEIVVFDVCEWLTRFGGVGKVVLVITLVGSETTHSELYNFPALLQFKNRPTGSEPDSKEYQSMTTLAINAKNAADIAEKAKSSAESAQAGAEAVKSALTQGLKVRFDGKRTTGGLGIFESILNEINTTLGNPVSSKAVDNYVKGEVNKIDETIKNIKSQILLAAHPVGSLYWSSSSTSPSELFGGTWKRITDTFIWAAGDNDVIGKSEGNKTVTLTAENIAPHTHTNIYFNEIGVSFRRYTETNNMNKYAMGWQRNSDIGVYNESLITTGENNYGLDEDGNAKTQQPVNIMPPYKAYYCWIRVKEEV